MESTIVVTNVFSYILGTVPFEIFDACSLSSVEFYKDRYKKTRARERKRCYFNRSNSSFPTGWLFSKIIPLFKQLGISYTIVDKRDSIIPTTTLLGKFPFAPRNYQLEAVAEVTTNAKHRGIISIGTGGGKSFIAAKIIEYFGNSTLYIVPSLLLLHQTYDNFVEWFGKENIGIVGEGEFSPSLVTIATEQTIWARIEQQDTKDLLNNVKILVLDEAHKIQTSSSKKNALGNTWYRVAMLTPNARVRIGMTATPGKDSSYGRHLLEAATGRIIYEKSLSWLMENNFLSKLVVEIYKIPIKTSYKTWEESYSENILKNEHRNRLIVNIATRLDTMGYRTLIIVNRIEDHGKVLMKMLKDRAESLYGENSSAERQEVLARFKSKKTRIIVSTIIKEGIDLPDMDAIILASGGKGGEFGKDLLQKLGRVVRKTEEKDRALLFDFFDDDGYTYYVDSSGKDKKSPNILFRHSLQRLRVYKREKEFEIKFNE